jgi:hypothetical protein
MAHEPTSTRDRLTGSPLMVASPPSRSDATIPVTGTACSELTSEDSLCRRSTRDSCRPGISIPDTCAFGERD